MNTVKELLSSRRMIWKLAKNDFRQNMQDPILGFCGLLCSLL